MHHFLFAPTLAVVYSPRSPLGCSNFVQLLLLCCWLSRFTPACKFAPTCEMLSLQSNQFNLIDRNRYNWGSPTYKKTWQSMINPAYTIGGFKIHGVHAAHINACNAPRTWVHSHSILVYGNLRSLARDPKFPIYRSSISPPPSKVFASKS